jgi:hypothetical protein
MNLKAKFVCAGCVLQNLLLPRKMLKDIEDMEKPNAQCRSTQPQGTIHLRQRIHGNNYFFFNFSLLCCLIYVRCLL